MTAEKNEWRQGVGDDKEGYDKAHVTVYDVTLAEWLLNHGAPEGMSEFILEKGMGERLDVYVHRPATVTFTFYIPALHSEDEEQE